METEDLFEAMTREVAQRCEERLAAARREAEAIRAAACEQAESERGAALCAEEEENARLATEACERAASEAQRDRLFLQQRVADEILQEVERELARMANSDGFRPVVEALLVEALEDAPADARILAPRAHLEPCRALARERRGDGVRVEPSDTLRDGVVVEDAARTFRCTNTLGARLAKIRNEARRLCLMRLLGEEEAG